MPKINSIRDMRKGGSSISEISRQTGCDPKTIKKYIEMDDFRVPVPVTEKRGSKLDPYKPIIDDWMAQDQREWHKQQHTAKRIHDRLLAEYDWKGSYPLVQRYVKEKKAEMRQGKVYQDLVWDPGSMQVDFGQADFIVAGVKTRMHYLVATLPYSNISFVQVFGGETSECVCQGLKDIFEHLGGVPERIVSR